MSDLAFVTWSDASTDREDAGYFLPSTLNREDRLKEVGALALSDVVESVDRSVKPNGTGVITYIDIAAVDARTGDITATEIPASEAPSRARKLVATGDILISSVRPERNAVARIPATLDGAIASTGFIVVRPLSAWGAHLDRIFLYLKTDLFIRQAVRRCTSSMYPVIAEADLMTILVPRRILDEAGPAQEALQRADTARNRADDEFARARALMTDLVSDLTAADQDPKPIE